MRLAIEAGTVADGTLEGAIQYSKALEIERLALPFETIEGYRETGALDLTTAKTVMAKIAQAGLSASVMVYRAPPQMVENQPEGEADFANFCKSLDVMAQIGAEILAMFAIVEPPHDPSQREVKWQDVLAFYRRLMQEAEQRRLRVGLHTVAMPERNLLWDYAAYRRLMSEIPSSSNGVTFCVGNFWDSDGDRLYDIIHELGERIFYVRLCSTQAHVGEKPFRFDGGGPDLKTVLDALRRIHYTGDMCAEQRSKVPGESRTDIGTAWAIGYLKALLKYV